MGCSTILLSSVSPWLLLTELHFQDVQYAATASCYRQNMYSETANMSEKFSFIKINTHIENWFRKWYLLNAKKKYLVDVFSLIKIKGKLRREAHNCKSIASIKVGNTGWLMKWLFYDVSGSEVVCISNICHALQLLSCQCTQHIMNKWVAGKQLDI